MNNTFLKTAFVVLLLLVPSSYIIFNRHHKKLTFVSNDEDDAIKTMGVSAKNNEASIIIFFIHSKSDCFFIFQRKTADYPISIYANKLTILGGNKDDNETPMETLLREMKEEIPQLWSLFAKNLGDEKKFVKFFSSYIDTTQQQYLGKNKKEDYTFQANVFFIDIDLDNVSGITEDLIKKNLFISEGKIQIIHLDKLIHNKETFGWGYGYIVADFLKEIVSQRLQQSNKDSKESELSKLLKLNFEEFLKNQYQDGVKIVRKK